MKYNHLNFDNGLYYADTTNYAQKLMSRDSNGHYKVAKDFVDDKAVYQTSTYVWKSCLCDFNGFAKTRRGASLKKLAHYTRCVTITKPLEPKRENGFWAEAEKWLAWSKT